MIDQNNFALNIVFVVENVADPDEMCCYGSTLLKSESLRLQSLNNN